jgi:alpha-glucosidase
VTDPESRWWQTAVVCQIYPRSFCDSSGDGIGDLEGISQHLDDLSWLGVDAIWLSPFYRSPMADFGYDVSDYRDVDPLFGTLSDFDRLLAEAHRRHLKVLVDWVPNHTSDRHPWFVASRSSRDSPKRAWYWWRDDRPDGAGGSGPPGQAARLPNNWRSAFPGVGRTDFPPAWTWDEGSQQWYLHLFLAQQPDLNWSTPEVVSAMLEVLRFWLARGVDGFRIDAVQALGKDPALPDLPPELAAIPMSSLNDQPSTQPIVAAIRSEVDAWPDPPPRLTVGEVYLPEPTQVVRYYGTTAEPGLHMAFNFKPLFTGWNADDWRQRIVEAETVFDPGCAWPTWVLSNHDRPRHRTRYGSERRARAAAVLLLSLRGTPFLFAGEELGLEDAIVPPDRRVDPGGRDGCRAPIPWDGTPAHGWAGGAEAWLPWPPEADAGRTVAEQRHENGSMLQLYRRILAVRKNSDALRSGAFSWWEGAAGASGAGEAGAGGGGAANSVLAYFRTATGLAPGGAGQDLRLVAVNFSDAPAAIGLPAGSWLIEVTTATRSVAAVLAGRLDLEGDEAVILRPA